MSPELIYNWRVVGLSGLVPGCFQYFDPYLYYLQIWTELKYETMIRSICFYSSGVVHAVSCFMLHFFVERKGTDRLLNEKRSTLFFPSNYTPLQ